MKTVKEINNYVGYKVEIFPTEEQKSIFNRYLFSVVSHKNFYTIILIIFYN